MQLRPPPARHFNFEPYFYVTLDNRIYLFDIGNTLRQHTNYSMLYSVTNTEPSRVCIVGLFEILMRQKDLEHNVHN